MHLIEADLCELDDREAWLVGWLSDLDLWLDRLVAFDAFYAARAIAGA